MEAKTWPHERGPSHPAARRRRIGLQPRVAVKRLPWEHGPASNTTPMGVVSLEVICRNPCPPYTSIRFSRRKSVVHTFVTKRCAMRYTPTWEASASNSNVLPSALAAQRIICISSPALDVRSHKLIGSRNSSAFPISGSRTEAEITPTFNGRAGMRVSR